MKAFQIENIKDFMAALFMKPVFDNFLLVSFEIGKDMTVSIDGTRNRNWYDSEMERPPYMKWGEVRETASFLVKGKRSPLFIKAVLRLSKENTKKLIGDAGGEPEASGDTGLYFNLKFDESGLTIITGSSVNDFKLAGELNRVWDKDLGVFLKHYGIAFTEM